MEDLKQLSFQRRFMVLLDNLINMAQQRVETVPFFDGFIDQMHHSPIQLHLLLQIALQGPHKIIKALQSHLHLLRINLIVHINLLLGLNSSLPILLLVIGLIGPQMKIYLIAWFPLLLQNLKSLLIRQVNLQILLTVSVGIAIEPLKKDNIIVELSFANLLEGERLCDFKFFQGIFDKFDVSIIMLGVFGGKIQFEYIDGARMYCVYHLRIGNSIAQTLYRSILCLHQSVYPLQQFLPSQVHLNLQQINYEQFRQEY